MAVSLEELWDKLTCCICFEIFREPVTLPCKHSYCRECLQAFADKSEHTIVSRYNESDAVVISCPQCRATTQFGREGVAGLSVNTDLVERSTQLDSATRPHKSSLLCSLCENDNQAEAVKFCPACCFLYCEECLSVLHPMRGAMREHSLISMEEYLSQIGRHDVKLGVVKPTPSCDLHKKSFIIYCVTCQTLLCSGCLADHNEHIMSDILAAREKMKVPFLKDTKKCKTIQHELKKSIANLKDLEKDIQVAVKDLELKSEEMERIMMSSDDLAASKDIVFLQGFEQLAISVDKQLSEMRNSLETRDIMTRLHEALEVDSVVSRELELSQQQVTQPVLKFTKTNNRELKISDDGSLIEGNSLTACKKYMYSAWTDGLLQSGRITWGLEITAQQPSPDYLLCCCYTGVVRRGCGLYSKPGTTSWYITMNYRSRNVRCNSPSNCRVNITLGYNRFIPHIGPHRLGFSLNCKERTLTVTDIAHNQLMATVRDIDLSEPVTPAVGFHSSASARLFCWDSSTLLDSNLSNT